MKFYYCNGADANLALSSWSYFSDQLLPLLSLSNPATTLILLSVIYDVEAVGGLPVVLN